MPKASRPLSGYFYFVREHRAAVAEELRAANGPDGSVAMGEVAKALGAAWKALSEEERAKYGEFAKKEFEEMNRNQAEEERAKCGEEARQECEDLRENRPEVCFRAAHRLAGKFRAIGQLARLCEPDHEPEPVIRAVYLAKARGQRLKALLPP
ncbi:unnamed protein product [Ostreobium quekettii]|uniref:HMG box domain-containing protein n=1 Tax=Ostreobium quekettii TaxID=121088 RepID=A0A8S1J5Y5_9CHLO|nr:unnamed protein product [Ostreobium quekettii]